MPTSVDLDLRDLLHAMPLLVVIIKLLRVLKLRSQAAGTWHHVRGAVRLTPSHPQPDHFLMTLTTSSSPAFMARAKLFGKLSISCSCSSSSPPVLHAALTWKRTRLTILLNFGKSLQVEDHSAGHLLELFRINTARSGPQTCTASFGKILGQTLLQSFIRFLQEGEIMITQPLNILIAIISNCSPAYARRCTSTPLKMPASPTTTAHKPVGE